MAEEIGEDGKEDREWMRGCLVFVGSLYGGWLGKV